MKVMGYIATCIVIMIINTLWSAFALCKLWGWFIVSTFGLPPIGMTTAIGISMVVSYMTQSVDTKTNDDSFSMTLARGVFIGLLKPAFALLFGWIVTWFM